MLWFSGSIPEAIVSSKQRKLPFVVYIEGEDDSSNSMNTVWEDPKVTELFTSDKCVAIKLKKDSEECTQFSQLYPVVCVPSVFFIDQNGMPLELVGGAVGVDEFIGKTSTAFETFQKQISSVQESIQLAPLSSTSNAQEATPSSTVEERVERAKRLIEEKRKEKQEKEKREQLEKETKRRQEGQELTLAKKEKEDRKQREIVNQIREDKAKEKAAREAVLKQIAQDKAEREVRRQNELRERKLAPTVADVPSTSQSGSSDSRTPTKPTSTITRLQFRLPDGSSVMHTFQADALLEAARQFIESQMDSGFNSITLSTVYPRRQLTEEDMNMTLTSLQLVPSATLIVSPGSSTSSAVATSSSSGFSGIVMIILAPFLAIYNFVKVFIFGGSDNPRGSYGGQSNEPRREEVKERGTDSSNLRRRTGNQGIANKEGNIHRLRNKDDDDDENNTWNGNSTQQM
ncbi:UBX domain-containing protein 4-like [Actinia tenebrosa]|uniref:UBX domain-containing protein 4 n=1 Tax=Actinia tenebrosa TaxID=6105 RepID=A0A6P8IUZ8_ACTTE|nr:UBX domain-containing protein 4-like [Actinia tenebrosa]